MSNDPAINAALLNFCASVDDGPRGPPPAPRDPADFQWLREAISSVETPERQIQRLLNTVDAAGNDNNDRDNNNNNNDESEKNNNDNENSDKNIDECVGALEELADLVEDINWSTEYALMKGPARTLRLLQSSPLAERSPAVRAAAARVIAHSAQLHARVQNDYAAAQWADVLLPLLRREQDTNTRAALLHACSCICRDDAANTAQFTAAGGAEALIALLSDGEAKIVRRALFFAAYLVEHGGVEEAGQQSALAECAGVFAVGEEEELQVTGARVLTALALRNAAGVREEMGSPRLAARVAVWRGAALDEDDSRRRLIDLIDGNERMMKLAAIGTLPDELIDAIRCGAVTAANSGSEILFCDAPTGRAWRIDMDAQSTAALTFLHPRSGPAPVAAAAVPRIAGVHAVPLSLAQSLAQSTAEATAEVTAEAVDPEPEPMATAVDVIARHRALAEAVARFLAPAPREMSELTRAFTPTPGSNGSRGDGAAALSAVLAALTTANRRGERELTADGYAMVDIDSFHSKGERLRVANLALPKVAHDKALVDRFAIHADRDVMLAVCSRGIMAGLGNAKRTRSDSKDISSDEDEAERKRAHQQQQQQNQNSQPVALFMTMEQSGIRWADGDLRAEHWVMPSAVKEALEAPRRGPGGGPSGGDGPIEPMPIATAAQLAAARKRYAVLLREHSVVRGHLRRLEDVTEAARQWAGGSGARFAPELRTELRQWFDAQEAPRTNLVVALGVLHKALYALKREIEDYVNLREWGVLME